MNAEHAKRPGRKWLVSLSHEGSLWVVRIVRGRDCVGLGASVRPHMALRWAHAEARYRRSTGQFEVGDEYRLQGELARTL